MKTRKRMEGENCLVYELTSMSRIGSNRRGADGVRVEDFPWIHNIADSRRKDIGRFSVLARTNRMEMGSSRGGHDAQLECKRTPRGRGLWGKCVDRVSSFDHLQCQYDGLN